jgi:hypothetical protein
MIIIIDKRKPMIAKIIEINCDIKTFENAKLASHKRYYVILA